MRVGHTGPAEGGQSVRTVSELLGELTIEEKVSLLSGQDVWRTAAVPRLGIPAIKVTDGPNGARGDSTTGSRSVCLPATISVAASFDRTMVGEVGRLLGRETARKGAHLLLAPTINIARNPLGGRNFESMGEDPYLTASIAEAYITGIQDEGVGACAKHFAANDTEYERHTVSSEVDERVLREVYLAPFERVVEAGVWSIMSAYSKLNGTHCSENKWLLSDLLRDEWGFDGFVISDWGATHHRSAPILAGQDLEMPGPPNVLGDNTLQALKDGELTEADIDARVRCILDFVIRSGRLGVMEEQPEQSIDLPEERQFARSVVSGGMVLLRNNGVLPLDPTNLKSLAVIGPNADPGVLQGGGSAALQSHHSVSPVQGLVESLGQDTVAYHQGCLAHRYLPSVPKQEWVSDQKRAVKLEVFDGTQLAGEAVVSRQVSGIGVLTMSALKGVADPTSWSQRYTGTINIEESGRHQFGVLAVGRSRVLINGELVADNWTDPQPGDSIFQQGSAEVVGEIELTAGTQAEVIVEWAFESTGYLAGLVFGMIRPFDEDKMMDDAVALAAKSDAVVLVVGQTAEWETEGSDRPLFGLPRRQNELVERVVAANPNTVVVLNAGGPVDMPWYDQAPAVLVAWYPGQEFGTGLSDVLLGAADPGGRLPVTFPKALQDCPTYLDVPGDGQKLHYNEGLFVGHRWYDARNIEPRAEFGAGMSYAAFDISDFEVGEFASAASSSTGSGGCTVSATVKNTSARAGKCVLQVYLEAPSGPQRRPLRSLAGFASTQLQPGEETTIDIAVAQRCFEIWSKADGWSAPSGAYRLHVGTSSRQLLGSVTVTV